ncbi:FAD-dependent oxidoreductase [Kribbella sp. HUAS MG21]|uniref:FAD-dependent oxidoreductase n=1 Tax=Kribbella sp. HUAS MG21 TaxID=3160966 RepID=A0AAU7TED3_9ACTN
MRSSPYPTRPERVAVIGAGITGLSAAWFLRAAGTDTTVFEQAGVGSGASRGNAGWLTPSLATPLPEPSVLRFGLRALLSPASPVYVPPSLDLGLWRFLVQFARNCTATRWERSMAALAQLSVGALAAYDELEVPEVEVRTQPATPLVAAYRDESSREVLVEEFRHLEKVGRPVEYELLSADEARAEAPLLSDRVGAALRLAGQRYLDPGAFVRGLSEGFQRRGGRIRTGVSVTAISPDGPGLRVVGERFDAVVIASGARLGQLAGRFGVSRAVRAGRGYSFTVAVDSLPRGPVYLPAQRVACTPVGGRLRLAGMMEFRGVDAPLDPRRIAAIVDAAAPYLTGVDLRERADEWVGARPCTVDGLPLVGRTSDPRVFVSGGHGMWGMTLGPVTGKLLAEFVTTGRMPDALRSVDPLR